MRPKNSSSLQSPDYFHRLSKAIGFAVSEWLLMFLLFIDACFTYLIAKFASYCQLQSPCVLCSRYDHVLVKNNNNNKGNYWDSICNHHKSEISSLVRSHAADTLVVNGERVKNEKNIFVDESLDSFESSHAAKNRTGRSMKFEYQKLDVTSSDNKLEIPVNWKSDSQFEVCDINNDSATVAARDSAQINEVPFSNNAETRVDAFLDTNNSPMINDAITNGYQTSNHLELGDAYKLAISTKGRQFSGKLSFKDSSKILLSHISNDSLIISPKLSLTSDELMGMQMLQSRASLERNESNISYDGSVVSEIEGESVVDRLKRQVEHDQKVIRVLYKELEEERNASAVAANQAMAMITKLQEEKAALYTEALQCLRVMEEQAEYDNEALQNANDVIETKDKRIRELEKLVKRTYEDVRE